MKSAHEAAQQWPTGKRCCVVGCGREATMGRAKVMGRRSYHATVVVLAYCPEHHGLIAGHPTMGVSGASQ